MNSTCIQCNTTYDVTCVSNNEMAYYAKHYVCSKCKSNALYSKKNRLVEDDMLPQSDEVTKAIRDIAKEIHD